MSTEVAGEDAAAIAQLYAKYSQGHDFGEPGRWVEVFTPAGTLALHRPGASGPDVTTGADALRAKVEAKVHRVPPSDRPMKRHVNDTLVLDLLEDGAVAGRAYFRVLDHADLDASGRPAVASSGIYRDRIVRTDDGWRFDHRAVTYDE
ncbi:MAG TPA: nuclear transport factor 2 family protein [Acidimicrobiales bacterium]